MADLHLRFARAPTRSCSARCSRPWCGRDVHDHEFLTRTRGFAEVKQALLAFPVEEWAAGRISR